MGAAESNNEMDDPIGKWCCNEREKQQYDDYYDNAPLDKRRGRDRVSEHIMKNLWAVKKI
jgi:hypothetical protein